MEKLHIKRSKKYSPGKSFKISAFIFFLLVSVPDLKAQFYEYGQSPPSLEWKKLESEHFTLIYPEGIRTPASKLLLILEGNYYQNSQQLKNTPEKVPVILHNHTVRSNGFVVWGPKRMEMFMHPDVHPISQDWLNHLSLHEFRHVVQVDKLNQGITAILTTVLGEQGIAPAAGMVPFWFYEGDAIYAETSLSKSGRGRSPAFEMRLKAHLLEDEKIYSFSKAYLGSYKDYVPDYYQYGYHMVAYGREKFGNDFWTEALDYTGRNIYFIDPMAVYLKRETGRAKKGLYDSSMYFIKNHWEKQRKDRKFRNYQPLNKSHRLYTSYKSPQITEKNTVIAIKSSLDILNRIVLLNPSGEEKLLHIPGRLYSGRISYSKNRIVWDEYLPDIRWTNRSFSVLKEYNTLTGELRQFGRKSRYSSPAYSFSGDTILTIETTLSNKYNLVFLSAADGQEIFKVASPQNIQILDPAWIDSSDRIVLVGLDENGKQLLQYDRSNNQWKKLLQTSEINISSPVSSGNYIIFNGSFNGLDNIFAYYPDTKEIFILSRSEFGAFQPDVSANNDLFVFSDYTANGYNIVLKPLKESEFESLEIKPVTEQPFFRYGDDTPDLIPINNADAEFLSAEERYKGPGRLFNFHSWSPFYFDYTDPDLENPSISPGITLLSQNLLSTAVTSIGYEYANGDHFFHSRFTYKGLLPVFDLSYNFGGIPNIVQFEENEQPEKVNTASNFRLNTYIPLNFYSGRWVSGVQPSLKLTYYNDYFFHRDESAYLRGITYAEPRLYLYSFQRRAYRDYQPRFGAIFDYKSIFTPFEDEQRGSNHAIKTTLYLPGLFRGQGLKFRAEWQKQKPARYLYGNLVSFARGYEPLIATELAKNTLEYFIPLLYPDLTLDGIFYLKRVRANLFTDYIFGRDLRIRTDHGIELETGDYLSTGVELNLDYHVLRLLVPFSSGIRISYLEDTGKYRFEFLFDISLTRF